MNELIERVQWGPGGLAPVVIVDERSGAVLTLAYANREALERTFDTRSTWLYSRSRQALWHKGDTSGNTQHVVAVALDCDADALIYRVIPHGPACHTGAASCFGDVVAVDPDAGSAPESARFAAAVIALAQTIAQRKIDPPAGSYTAKLFAGGVDRIGKKIGEEAMEVVIAAKNSDRGELVWESSDLLYHLLVILAERGVTLDEIGDELARRAAGVVGALENLAGIGPQTAAKFAELGITSTGDLLAYLPRAYRDWRVPMPIATLREEGAEAIVVGRVQGVREKPGFGRRGRGPMPQVSVDLADETGSITATWFGRTHLFGKFAAGDRLMVVGRVARSRRELLYSINVTAHRALRADEPYVGEVVPVYSATQDLPTRTIRATIAKNLDRLIAERVDALPSAVVEKFGFPAAADAWRGVHAPRDPEEAEHGRRRIVFEEFFGIALAAALKRAQREAAGGATPVAPPDDWYARFTAELAFVPTGAQERVIEQIAGDMARSAPMNRLLQGDVGSGKTLVAAAAIVLAHLGGLQSALMAPTEILAAQHAAKLGPLLFPFGIAVEAIFGSMGARSRREANERLGSGEAALAVGTHALLTESTAFARLGLVIVDEQHRFGVQQRARLRAKGGATPHALYMTATPIPRTLAQTKYADLDLAIIDELPPGRTPIKTFVIRNSRKDQIYEFVRKNVTAGRQAYIVAPAIDASESALTSAIEEAEKLRRRIFPELRVELLHGKLESKEKDAVMNRFKRGEIDVLVATTVVEVGVDVANASVMVILDAHRYGLAQLHQLRGRVGRGVAESYCMLVVPDDSGAIARLEELAATTDGFKIAEMDLEMRRSGELAGTAQAGGDDGLIGNFIDDFALYMQAKAEAEAIVGRDPDLQAPEHRGLRALIDETAAARALLVTA